MSVPLALSAAELDALVAGRHRDPFAVLGPHTIDGAVAVRAFRPGASAITFVERSGGARHAMRSLHQAGVFEVVRQPGRCPTTGCTSPRATASRIRSTTPTATGRSSARSTCTSSPRGRTTAPTMHSAPGWSRTAARPACTSRCGRPTRERVSVVGDFNGWDGRVHPMRLTAGAGVWEIFLPGLGRGRPLQVRGARRARHASSRRPIRTAAASRPRPTPPRSSGSGGYAWRDDAWMAGRAAHGRWRRRRCRSTRCTSGRGGVPSDGRPPMTYREMAETLVPYVKQTWASRTSSCCR